MTVTTITVAKLLLLLAGVGVAADPGMFARRIVRGAARMSVTEQFCPAYGHQGRPLLPALKNTRTNRVVGSRTACLAAQLPASGEAGNGQREDGSKRLGREIAQALQSKGARLVLHFDLNKTLIMVDPAGRKTQSQVLNSVLSEISWGHVESAAGAEEARSWQWDGCPPSPEPPWRRTSSSSIAQRSAVSQEKRGQGPSSTAAAAAAADAAADASFWMSYSDFLHQEFRDAEGKDNRRMKDLRDERKGSFSEEGHPGAGLRASYLALERALTLPKAVGGSPLAKGAGLAGRKSYYVLPSFFSCLLVLKEAEVDFGVVFRTFGDDIEAVSREYNAFCQGAHPLFPGVKMDGSDGYGDYRIHLANGNAEKGRPSNDKVPNTVGAFFRDEEGIALVMGTLDNPEDRRHLRSMEEAGHQVYRSSADIHCAICESVTGFTDSPSADVEPGTAAVANPAATAAAKAGAVTGAGAPPYIPEATLSPTPRGEHPMNSNDSAECGGRKARGRCLALRDFYPFWRAKLEDAAAGKVLPVDLSQDSEVWPVMFDDNIGRADSVCGAHIVDVRDVATGKSVPFGTALRRHIVRAEPFLAIDQDAPGDGNGDGAAAASGCNFFLLEVLKRVAPERAKSFVNDPDVTGGFIGLRSRL